MPHVRSQINDRRRYKSRAPRPRHGRETFEQFEARYLRWCEGNHYRAALAATARDGRGWRYLTAAQRRRLADVFAAALGVA
jgi:hypothetical protein